MLFKISLLATMLCGEDVLNSISLILNLLTVFLKSMLL